MAYGAACIEVGLISDSTAARFCLGDRITIEGYNEIRYFVSCLEWTWKKLLITSVGHSLFSNWTAILNTTWHSLVVLRTVTEHGGLVVATRVRAVARVIYYCWWLDSILLFFFNLNKNQFSNTHRYQATLELLDSYLEILQYCSHQSWQLLIFNTVLNLTVTKEQQ